MQTATELLKAVLTGQFEAALAMLREAVEKCPEAHWDGPIVKYPFWQVAYHTLCFLDLYLSPGEASYTPRAEFHPQGIKEFDEEYPSRKFSRDEILRYVAVCHEKLRAAMVRETAETLAGGLGVPAVEVLACGGAYLQPAARPAPHGATGGACLEGWRGCGMCGDGVAITGTAWSIIMAWLILFVAGLLEVAWAIGLKYTHGFTRLWPSVFTVTAIVASMYLLALAARTLPIGTAYAVWVGIGAAGTAVLGIWLLKEPVSAARVVFLSLLLVSIVGLKFSMPAAPAATP